MGWNYSSGPAAYGKPPLHFIAIAMVALYIYLPLGQKTGNQVMLPCLLQSLFLGI